MASAFKCPRCGLTFRVDDRVVGGTADCPKCDLKLKLASPASPRSGTAPQSFGGESTNPASPSSSQSMQTGGTPSLSTTSQVSLNVPKVAPSARHAAPSRPQPDTNPEIRVPQPAAEEQPRSRVAERRASRRVVRRKLTSAAPPQPTVKKSGRLPMPAIYGFLATLGIGVIGWGMFLFLAPDEPEIESVEPTEPTDAIVIDGAKVSLTGITQAAAEQDGHDTEEAAAAEAEQQQAAAAQAERLKKK